MTHNTEILKTLAQTTYDSIEGYRKAAEKAESPGLKEALENRARQRALTLGKLNDGLQGVGETPVNEASATGRMHHFFVSVTDAFQDGDKAAAKRVEEGEDYLAEKFEEALKLDNDKLDAHCRSIIQSAYQEVREGERFGDMLKNQFA